MIRNCQIRFLIENVYKFCSILIIMANGTKQILEKLEEIKLEIDNLKGKITDMDLILTEDDVETIRTAEKDLKEGNTKRLN